MTSHSESSLGLTNADASGYHTGPNLSPPPAPRIYAGCRRHWEPMLPPTTAAMSRLWDHLVDAETVKDLKVASDAEHHESVLGVLAVADAVVLTKHFNK
eukprot:g34949.t1